MAGDAPNYTKVPGYRIERIYLVHCNRCNMEITRAENGQDETTLAGARLAAHEHQKQHEQDDALFPEAPDGQLTIW